ncbi:histidine kinase [Winogradskyella eckloniae]|uniref:tetratricopeptide repeat-containing sensor histidine kinase n=1 Tax=Winogradskyella eckloniae TaxID=1089306 RepID=UPI0015638F57|nr:histidine kinase [Winogradskyella eckloniae]NRD20878.1 histidine kinase [Winogradskyella eckloniae]
MSPKLLRCLILLFPILCTSQELVKDSLLLHFNSITNDSLRNLEYRKAAITYKNSNPTLHLFVVEQAIKSAKSKKHVAQFTAQKGMYFEKKGELDSAITYYKTAINKFRVIKDTLDEYKAKSLLANAFIAKGDYELAIQTIKKNIAFFESKKGHSRDVLFNKNNLGALYVSIKDWENAKTYVEEIYKHPITKKNKRMLSSTLINLVAIHTEVNELDKALNYAHEAETLEKRPRSLANLYHNLGNLYMQKANYKTAESYFLKSLKLNETLKSEDAIQTNYNNLGQNALRWGKYKMAEQYLLQSNASLKTSNNIVSLAKNYELLSSLNTKTKNYKKALEYSLKEKQISDSILGIEKQKAIADFEVAYQTEKKEREKNIAQQQLKISQLESTKNKNLFYSAIIIAGLLLLAGLFYYSRFKTKKKAELVTLELKETQKRLALEKQYKDSELKALKAQMNPHFIFNALNSIQDYIVLNQKNLASDYLGKFADLIRNYLHFSDTGFISVPEEVHNLKLYLELEKLRFEDALDFKFNIEANANSEAIKIPTMLIQPYVENALKHGLLHKKDNRTLRITIAKPSEKIIECIVEDNGVGREKSKAINQKRKHQHKSFALKATTQRLDLLNFGKERKIGVEIIDLKNNQEPLGTKVVLQIPILTT